ncbi:hypothetical protein FCJ57_16555 [Burkholderia diffusa]|nr:hypothetical protein [Burkholderia diffusa]
MERAGALRRAGDISRMAVWRLAFGVWRLAFGVWCSAFGARCSAFGARRSVISARRSALGARQTRRIRRVACVGRQRCVWNRSHVTTQRRQRIQPGITGLINVVVIGAKPHARYSARAAVL